MLIANTKPDIIKLQETNGDFSIPGCDRYVQPSIIQKRKGTQVLCTPPTMEITYVERTRSTVQQDTMYLNNFEIEDVATTTMVDGHNITIVN